MNPFAFPAETNIRFTLLVATALMLMCSLGTTLAASLPGYSSAGWAGGVELLVGSGSLMLLLLALASVIYLTYPGRIRRNKHLQPLARETDPAFVDAVRNLAALAQVSPAPLLELGPGGRSLDGQAFGFRGRPILRLGGGLRLLLRKASDRFRAIVLHELAHIANRDVGRTYLALALWSAFIILFIPADLAIATLRGIFPAIQELGANFRSLRPFLPLAVAIVGGVRFILVAVELGITLFIVVNIRNSVLRIREVYADWRVVQWGAEAPLRNILEQNAGQEKPGLWTRLWRLHPTPQERLAMLQDPTALFRVSPLLAFMVAFLLAYFFAGGYELLLRLGAITFAPPSNPLGVLTFVPDEPLPLRIGWLTLFAAASLPVLYFLAGSVGLQVQRDAVADLACRHDDRRGYLRLVLPACLVPLGFEVGVWFFPDNHLRNITPGFIWLPIWWLGLAGMTWLALVYTRFFARRLLGTHAGGAPPDGARRGLTLGLTGLTFLLYLPLAIGRELMIDPPFGLDRLGVVLIAILLVDAVVLYPLAFAATWVLSAWAKRLRRPHCPACAQPFRAHYAVGRFCEHCGSDLAPWLFVDPQVQREPESERTFVERQG